MKIDKTPFGVLFSLQGFSLELSHMKHEQVKGVREPEFGKRVNQAADLTEDIPSLYYGRLTEVQKRLKEHGVDVTLESVRRWFYGESRPRHKAAMALAKVLNADPIWLMMGITPELNSQDRDRRARAVEGAAAMVLGIFELNGLPIFFPDAKDDAGGSIDFSTVIKKRPVPISVVLARPGTSIGTHELSVVRNYNKLHTVGVIQTSPVRFDMIHVPQAVIKDHGNLQGGYVTLQIDSDEGSYFCSNIPLPIIRNPAKTDFDEGGKSSDAEG